MHHHTKHFSSVGTRRLHLEVLTEQEHTNTWSQRGDPVVMISRGYKPTTWQPLQTSFRKLSFVVLKFRSQKDACRG